MNLNDMTFGIEIECAIPVTAMQAQGWAVGGYHRGENIPGFEGWKAMEDASIHTRYPRIACEVVSPILKGAEGLEQVRRMLATLKQMGASVNRSTGFHVHIGWGGDASQLRRLICFVAYHEKALFATTGTHSREHNQYCSSIKLRYRALENLQTLDAIAMGHTSRYHVLNLTNLIQNPYRPAKNTVEFRVFAGTLNIVKIEAYIQLCLGMVEKAMDRAAQLPWDAPASKRQAKEGIGDGMLAVRRLINHLGWFANGNRRAYGMLDRDRRWPVVRAARRNASCISAGRR